MNTSTQSFQRATKKSVGKVVGTAVLVAIVLVGVFGAVQSYSMIGYTSTVPANPASRIVITFDDVGYGNSVWETAYPTLQQYNCKAVAYVIVNKVNRADAITGLKMLASAGWEIGSHSMTHANLTSLSASSLLTELVDSKIWLEANISANVSSFAYPYSTYNVNVLNFVRQYYSNARTNSWWAYESSTYNNAVNYEIPSIAIANGNYAYNIPMAIKMSQASGKTVVLLFHRVMLNGDGPSITPDNFSWCIRQISESGIPVTTFKGLTA